MDNLQWYDYFRMLTMVLGVVTMYLLARRFVRLRHTYTDRLKELWWVMNAFLVLLIEGTAEQILFDVHWGPRTLLAFFVVCVALRATLRAEGFIKTEPQIH